MDIKITPGRLSGKIKAISSKSHGHRLLIAAALSEICKDGGTITQGIDSVRISNPSLDIAATKDCLLQLANPEPFLNCKESGSSLRFLLPVAMVLKNRAVFTGEGRLLERPISPLKEQMEAHGCTFHMNEPEKGFTVTGSLTAGDFALPGNISSQYVTGLLFALPLLKEDSTIEITTPLESGGYIDLTIAVLEKFGIEITKSSPTKKKPLTYHIRGGQQYMASENLTAEGDWSNMAFWLTANALGSNIICSGINIQSVQGDKAILDVLASYENLGSPYDKGAPVVVDAGDIPDLIPIIAVRACIAPRMTKIINAGRLRLKESDRLESTFQLLRALGAEIVQRKDGLQIKGRCKFTGGIVDGYNDHRIVMAAAIAATVCKYPVIIRGAEAVDKSYPDFFKDFAKLGGILEEVKQ